MYNPVAFRVSDEVILFEFIETHPFGILFSADPIQTSHLPILIDRESGKRGSIVGHMAKANDHWQHAEGHEVQLVFSGPQTYISSSWFDDPYTVPTWNYVAVHATGTFRRVDQSQTVDILFRYLQRFESRSRSSFRDDELRFMEKLAMQVVGFRIDIETLEGKWKLSQNHSQQRQQKAIDSLRQRPDDQSHLIAELMAKHLEAAHD